MVNTGWFADYEDDEDSPWYGRWIICLETGQGLIPTLDGISFDTKEDAEAWMRTYVIGQDEAD